MPDSQIQVDEVNHPTLGPLKFPVSMPIGQRNQLIAQMEQEGGHYAQNYGLASPGKAPQVNMQEVSNPIYDAGREAKSLAGDLLSPSNLLHMANTAYGSQETLGKYNPATGRIDPSPEMVRRQQQPFYRNLGDDLGINTDRVLQNSKDGKYGALGVDAAVPLLTMLGMSRAASKMQPGNLAESRQASHAENLANVLTKPGDTDVFSTVHPVIPDLRNSAAQLGVTAGDFQGRQGMQRLADISQNAIANHEAYVKSIGEPFDGRVVSSAPLASAIRAEITPAIRRFHPELAQQLEAKAQQFNGTATLGEINQERIDSNKRLSGFYGKDTSGQIEAGAATQADKAVNKAARDLYYDRIAEFSGIPEDQIRDLKTREGSLIGTRSLAEQSKINVSNAQAAYNDPLRKRLNQADGFGSAAKNELLRVFHDDPANMANVQLRSVFGNLDPYQPQTPYRYTPSQPQLSVQAGQGKWPMGAPEPGMSVGEQQAAILQRLRQKAPLALPPATSAAQGEVIRVGQGDLSKMSPGELLAAARQQEVERQSRVANRTIDARQVGGPQSPSGNPYRPGVTSAFPEFHPEPSINPYYLELMKRMAAKTK